MKRFATIAGFFLLCMPAFAQFTGSLSGVVADGSTRIPLPNVLVMIDSISRSTTTSQNGLFTFPGLEEGYYILHFSHLGYSAKTEKVFIPEGGDASVAVFLHPEAIQIQEVVIEESRIQDNAIRKLPFVQTSILRDQINETAGRDIGDMLRSSQNISGIRKGGGNIDPVVRGFKFSQLNVHLNKGVKVEGGCPNRMDPATSHVEAEDVTSIDVIKGPYSLRYGPAMGAVVHVQTLQPEPDPKPFVNIAALKGYETNWNGNREHLSVSGGNRIGFFQLSGGRKEYDDYKDGNGKRISSSFTKNNLRGSLGIRPFQDHLLRVSIEDLKGRDVMFPALAMDERNDDTRLYSAGYRIANIPGRFSFVSFHLYRSEVLHEMDNKQRPVSDTVVAVTLVEALNRGGRIEGGLKWGPGQMIAGIDLEMIDKDGDRTKNMIRQPGLPVVVEMIWNNARITNVGFFGEYTASQGKYDWIVSARIDHNEAGSDEVITKKPGQGEIYHYGTDSIGSEYTNVSFSAGATRRLNDNWSASLALGSATRSPDMTERFIVLLPVGYDRFDYLGDPKLKPETNNQVDLTLKFIKNNLGALQINGFYSIVNNYITGKRLAPSAQPPLTAGVLGVKKFHNAGTAMLRGFEFSYASPTGKPWQASLFAAATYGTLNESVQYILDVSGQAIGDTVLRNDPLTEIPPLEATLAFHYKILKGKLVPGIKLRVVSPQNHVSQAAYEETTPGFMLVGATVKYRFNQYFSLACGVNNLLDKAYYEHLNRAIIGSYDNLTEPGRSFFVNLLFKI